VVGPGRVGDEDAATRTGPAEHLQQVKRPLQLVTG
jgi:hypothetical protein